MSAFRGKEKNKGKLRQYKRDVIAFNKKQDAIENNPLKELREKFGNIIPEVQTPLTKEQLEFKQVLTEQTKQDEKTN